MTRRYGEGSVYQETSGRWCATLQTTAPDGSTRRLYRRAKTKRAALEKIRKVRSEVDLNVVVPDQRRTTGDWLEWWLSEIVPGTVRSSTLDGYRYIVETYLMPALGSVPLAKLGPQHVQTMLRSMERRGLSGWTRRQARTVLSGALNKALRYELLPRNVAALVDNPRVSARPDDTLSVDEARLLLGAVDGERLAAMVHLLVWLGVRRGEVLALRWSNADLGAGTLRIAGTLKRSKTTGLYVDPPKTKSSDRTVPLLPRLVAVLVSHREAQRQERDLAGEMWTDTGFVFVTELGLPIDPRNALRWWHRQLELAGLDQRPMHAARRTAVTLMAESGIPLEVAANIVGHSTIRMTAEVYNQVRPRAQLDAMKLLEQHLDGPRDQPTADDSGAE
jgi:integrase